jgi:hypothetical protein
MRCGGVIVNEPKIGPHQFKAEIERLQREGKLPSLEEVLEAVAKVRAESPRRFLPHAGAKRREALGSLKAPPLLRQRPFQEES